jgi:hypothetical protein
MRKWGSSYYYYYYFQIHHLGSSQLAHCTPQQIKQSGMKTAACHLTIADQKHLGLVSMN